MTAVKSLQPLVVHAVVIHASVQKVTVSVVQDRKPRRIAATHVGIIASVLQANASVTLKLQVVSVEITVPALDVMVYHVIS